MDTVLIFNKSGQIINIKKKEKKIKM